MTNKQNIQFEKSEKELNNMRVLTYRFEGESVKFVRETYTLSEEKQKDALDKMLDANPNYLDLSKEEQYGLIATTMTLETLVYWLIASGELKETPTMYNAYMDTGDTANLEFFFIEGKNADVLNQAFKNKSGKVVQLPRKKNTNKKRQSKKASIHKLGGEE